ncbi:MAG: hypothetical protein ACYTHJ_15750 [Planctomycetota bacterium]|jgi:hypothetical protein
MLNIHWKFSAALVGAMVTICCEVAEVRADSACCQSDGCIIVEDQATCTAAGGFFAEGETCIDGACGIGACCAGLSCGLDGSYACQSAGRTFNGAGTTCATDPCEIGVGACCNNESCSILPEGDCGTAGGEWLGPGTVCAPGLCVRGACCVPGDCFEGEGFECNFAGGAFHEDEICTAGPCEVALNCPSNSLYAHSRDPSNAFTAFASESSLDVALFDNYFGVPGTVSGLRFFGLSLTLAGEDFTTCLESSNTFEVTFYEDAGGQVGSPACTYTLDASRTNTGLIYLGHPLYEFNIDLGATCVLTRGWISIVGQADPDCWFFWLSSSDGDNHSRCEGCDETEYAADLNFCLLGEAGGVFGACCDESDGSCVTGDIADCIDLEQRFQPDVTCNELDPPCAQVVGACCFGDGNCVVEPQGACINQLGEWQGPGTDCEACAPTGACCFDIGICSPSTEADCEHTWAGPGTDCATDCFTLPECSESALFSQPVSGPAEVFAGTSELAAGFLRADDVFDVEGQTDKLTWWGFDAEFIPQVGFVDCIEDNNTFEIVFYLDENGRPGEVVCEETLVAERVPTGIIYFGNELNEYQATLSAPCTLIDGWISIVGLGSTDCWFLWANSDFGSSYCDNCESTEEIYDMSLCVEGTPGGIFGACCDDASGICIDGIEIDDCFDSKFRFGPDITCAELQPPCSLGACCFDDATCDLTTSGECDFSGGEYLGPGEPCSACPCQTPCVPGSLVEGEPVCFDEYVDDYNGGCDATNPDFTPIELCDTVCGESGIFFTNGMLMGDFDWYEVSVPQVTTLSWTVEAEFPVQLGIADAGAGCIPLQILAMDDAEECEPRTVSVPVDAGTYWLVVGPFSASGLATCGARYTAIAESDLPCNGDHNGNGAIDLQDYQRLAVCIDGPDVSLNAGCDVFDFNNDGDVDLADADSFWTAFTGSP